MLLPSSVCDLPHSEVLDEDQSCEKWNNPSRVGNAFRSGPVVDDIASGRNFERQNSEPTDGIFPSTGETPRRVDESADIHGEGTVDGIDDRHFGKSLHHQIARMVSFALYRILVRRTPEDLGTVSIRWFMDANVN